MGRAAGRGLPTAPAAPMGLTAPMRGIGGPVPGMMQPTGQGLSIILVLRMCQGIYLNRYVIFFKNKHDVAARCGFTLRRCIQKNK